MEIKCFKRLSYNKITNIEYPTFKDGYEIQLIIDSVLESIASKKWINIIKIL